MTETKKKNDFTQGAMWRNILKMGIPMVVASLVNVCYSVVDRIYIGHMAGVGSLALTGLGLMMPVISVVTACAALCGSGGGPAVSIARGEERYSYAENVMGNALTMLLFFGVLLSVVLQIFLEPILFAFGASPDTIGFAVQYGRIYLCGTLFVMLSYGMNHFINAQGFAKIGMLTVALGAAMNIVLDPIFIFALDMGIAGAALATVISQACSAAWAMGFLLSKRAILHMKKADLLPKAAIIKRITGLGITGFVMNITGCALMISYNVQLQRYGGDLYVGAMTVVNTMREVIHMITLGLADGARPVLGFNYGARRNDRVKQGIRFVLYFSGAYAIAAWIMMLTVPGILAGVLTNDPLLIAVCRPVLRIYFCGFLFMTLQMVGQTVFTSLGKAKQAVFFSMLRKVVIVIPLIFILPHVGNFGVMGVFWSEPISDLLGGAACFFTMYFTIYRKLDDPVLPESAQE